MSEENKEVNDSVVEPVKDGNKEVVKKKTRVVSVTPNPKKVAKEPETKESGWKMVPRSDEWYDLVFASSGIDPKDLNPVCMVTDTAHAYSVIRNLERPVIKL